MNIEEFRDFCLGLPGVTEKMPFEKFARGRLPILVFYVAGHMFCYFNIDDFSLLTIKCDPDKAVELRERYADIGDPYNGNRRHWIGVRLGGDVPDAVVLDLVREAHDLLTNNPVRGGRS